MNFLLQILIGIVFGVGVGLILGTEHSNFVNMWIAPIGIVFLRLLKMMVIPLVISSLIVGVTGLGDISKFGRIGGKTFGLYMLTTMVAISLGIGTAVLFEPGVGLNLQVSKAIVVKEMPSFSQMIVDFFPFNPIRSMMEENMMQLIVFSIALGIGILACNGKAKLLEDFAAQVAKICYKVVGWIMKFAPLGVFALIVPVVVTNGANVLLPLISIIVCVCGALLAHCILVYGSLLKFVAGINPFNYLKKIFPAVAFAFSSCSSSAALPVTITYCRWMNISKGVASFVLPLGATVNMDGLAVYIAFSAVFVAQVYSIEFSLVHYLYIAIFGTVFSIGAAGIPGGGLVSLSIFFSALGLPYEALALLAGVDRLLEMPRTAVNVTGDMVVCGIVAKSEGETLDV